MVEIHGFGFGVHGLGFGIQGLGFWVQGLGLGSVLRLNAISFSVFIHIRLTITELASLSPKQ